MPDLRPFRGLRYDPARVPDIGAALCPPYDVISERQREELLARSPLNAVRLELPAANVASATDADFARASATLESWISDGTLRRDERPMIYVYEQSLGDAAHGPARVRSFFCELRLEEYGPESGVRPHERTLAPAREHRFQLLGAVRAHLSPVLLIYDEEHGDGRPGALIDELSTGTPTIADGARTHALWAVDPEVSPVARELLARVRARPLTIADGHHRYETALRYSRTAGAPAEADHVLALLFGSHSSGLGVAPWHRVIAGGADPRAILAAADLLFDAQRTAAAGDLLARLGASEEPGVVGIWTRSGGSVLRVRRELVDAHLPRVGSEQVRWLDVSVLSGTLSAMVGATEQELAGSGRLSYTHDAAEAVARVEQGDADVCFLLRPTPIDQVLAVAAAGDFMPPKSTYFYPKAATGLVFDPLDA